MEHMTIAGVCVVGGIMLFLVCFTGYFIGIATKEHEEKMSPGISLFGLFGLIFFVLLIVIATRNGAGVSISGGDPSSEVRNLAVGHTYELVWQGEDGKHVLLQKEDGEILFYKFEKSVPKKFFVKDDETLSSLEK